jgi:HSP20 family protein
LRKEDVMTTAVAKNPAKTEVPARHYPVSRMEELMNEVERFWERSFPLRFELFGRAPELNLPNFDWSPRLDILEKEGELVLKADLPGMKKENIDIYFENGDLVLKGERKEEVERKEKEMYRSERYFGTFYRRIPLGFELDPKLVHAHFTNGVLELRIPMPPVKKHEPARVAIG